MDFTINRDIITFSLIILGVIFGLYYRKLNKTNPKVNYIITIIIGILLVYYLYTLIKIKDKTTEDKYKLGVYSFLTILFIYVIYARRDRLDDNKKDEIIKDIELREEKLKNNKIGGIIVFIIMVIFIVVTNRY